MEYRIPEGIVVIGKEWVENNIAKGVTKVICPSSLEEIGETAFKDYNKLEEIVLNEGLKRIGGGAFENCGIKNIKFPSTLKNTICETFYKFSNLKEVILNEGLKKIGWSDFCLSSIKSINIPKSVELIHQGAFQASKITKIVIPSNVKIIEQNTFCNCHDLREVIFKDGVENICETAFAGFEMNIKKVIIPNSVKFISEDAFAYLYSLNYEEYYDYSIDGEVIIGSESPIAKFSEDKLKKLFGPKANIIIKEMQFKVDAELFNNIKKVNDEEKHRLGLELFDEINKDEINLKKVQELLINGADTEIRDSNGNTGLMLMIKKGNNEVSMMYLLSGSDVNARNNLKETPLILASRSNNNDIASQLIDRNCIVNAITVLDESALSIAYDNGNIELVNRLENIFNISSKERELEEVHRIRKRILGGK